jgi:hypothetical protein
MSRRDPVESQKEVQEAQAEKQKEVQREGRTQEAAMSKAMQEFRQNPEFLELLRDAGLEDSVDEELGPMTSGAHVTAFREEDFENRRRWLNMAKGEQILTERDRGRLAKKTAIARAAHAVFGGSEPEPPDDFSSADKRDIREAMSAVTSLQSLGVQGEGLSAVSEITAVSKTETDEKSDSRSIKDKVMSIYG